MTPRQIIALAAMLACGCAALVWMLEKYEVGRLHAEVGEYLHNYDQFREWLRERET